MAGIQFLSKILGLAGLVVRKNGSNRQVTVDLSSEQVPDTNLNVYLPYKTGTILLAPAGPGSGVLGQILYTNADGTTSWATLPPSMKAGVVSSGSFTQPSPEADYEYSVVFTSAYGDTNYIVSVIGIDQRNWSYSNKTTSGFKIKTNSKTALTSEVSWFTSRTGS